MRLLEQKTTKLPITAYGRWLSFTRGQFWVTLTGDPRDHFLQAGETLWCPPKTEVVLQALESGEFCENKSDRALVIRRKLKEFAC